MVESHEEGLARLRRYRNTVQAGIVFSFDGEDRSTFEVMLLGAARIGSDGATVRTLTPFPKTPAFEELRRRGQLLSEDWSYYNTIHR